MNALLMNPVERHSNPVRLQWRTWKPDACAAVALPFLKAQTAHLNERLVAVFGLGAVGGRCLLMLARLGVGTLLGVDPDSYGPASWRTQPAVFGEANCKAWALGEEAHTINPAIRVLAGRGFAQDVSLNLLRRADVLVVAGDNLEVVIWAGNVAAALGKPLIQGAVHGETYTALVRAYDLTNPQNVCPACALGRREWAAQASRFGCDPQTAHAQGQEPTRTLPTICSSAADLTASEVLKWLEGKEQHALRGEELALCLQTYRQFRTTLPRNKQCRCPHRRRQLIDLDNAERTTPADLAVQLGFAGVFQVRAELPWIRFAICSACDRLHPVLRFAAFGSTVGLCPCGHEMQAAPLGSCSVIPGPDLKECLNVPLPELGLGEGAAVGLSQADDWTYFFLPGEPEPGSERDES
jgi:molybdopterin/thiamine biosynthesis adenylyltransferase